MKIKFWLAFGLVFAVSILTSAQTAKKTVTNQDLEKFRQQRLQAEAEYRTKYKELGMPSPEELQKRNDESLRWKEEFTRNADFQKQQNGDYWQMRASQLRNQILDINAQINFLNSQNNGFSNQSGVAVASSIYGVGYGYRQPQRVYQNNQGTANIANNVQMVRNVAAGNPNPYYGTPLYPSSIQVVIGQQNNRRYNRRGYGRNYGYYPVYPTANYPQQNEIVSRLQYLGQIRAGLFSQWENLVYEAHRAGVKIIF